MRGAVIRAAGLGLAGAGVAWLRVLRRQRANPAPCDYGKRFWVQLPKPFVRISWLRDLLAVAPGERVLEIGPGTGYYAEHVAGWLAPGGRLDILDCQQVMLDHTLRRAAANGHLNVVPTLSDAEALPYPDASFDAAYIMLALGEIPGQEAALAELARVLKPGARLCVGEMFLDPHMVLARDLRERAARAGLTLEAHRGSPLGYVARLRRA